MYRILCWNHEKTIIKAHLNKSQFSWKYKIWKHTEKNPPTKAQCKQPTTINEQNKKWAFGNNGSKKSPPPKHGINNGSTQNKTLKYVWKTHMCIWNYSRVYKVLKYHPPATYNKTL